MTDRNNSNSKNNNGTNEEEEESRNLVIVQVEPGSNLDMNVGPSTGHVRIRVGKDEEAAIPVEELLGNEPLTSYLIKSLGKHQQICREEMLKLIKGKSDGYTQEFTEWVWWYCCEDKDQFMKLKDTHSLPGLERTKQQVQIMLKNRRKAIKEITANIKLALSVQKTHEEAKKSQNHKKDDRNDGGANSGAGMVF